MSYDYQKFPRHQVAAEQYKTRGRNAMLSHYYYRVNPKLGKGVCAIFLIPREYPSCVAQLDKYWLPNCAPSTKPMYARV